MAYTNDQDRDNIFQEILGATNMLSPQQTAAQQQKPAADVVQQPVTTEQPTYEPGKFLKEYLKANEGFKPLTAEQQESEKKRQQRNLLLSSIGDAFSAFHTAYAKSRGVQPMVNPGESLTGKMRERYERLNKEREARDLTYNAGLQQAMQRDEQNALSWQTLKERAKQREAAEARYEQERQDKLAQQEKANKLAQDKFEQEKLEFEERNKQGYYKKSQGRGGTTTRKNEGWTTTVRDKDGKVKSTTTREYGSGNKGQQQGGRGNEERDANGNIIIKY